MARKTGTIKTFASLWKDHEKLYYSIFHNALEKLTISDKQRKDEDAISEALCPVLRKICFEHKQDVRLPAWEKPIQPVTNGDLKGGKVRKRPDFSCSFLNSLATSAKMYEIPFHVECKRLGDTVGTWNLNRNYVTKGVKRFDIKSHEYGKSAPSGMMIGYVINMEPTAIMVKINMYLADLFPKLKKLNINFLQKVVSCEQKLTRKKVKPKAFKIIHLWADLR